MIVSDNGISELGITEFAEKLQMSSYLRTFLAPIFMVRKSQGSGQFFLILFES